MWLRALPLLVLVSTAWAGPKLDPAQPLQRIAFGSCASQEKPQPIWDAILAAKPELLVLLGDNIYGDTDNPAILEAKYAQLAAVPGFKKLRAACPILAIYDDHDYGADDAGAEFPAKAQSQKLLLDFFEEPADSPRRKQEGAYGAWTFGPAGRRVQILLLDTRYFRSPLKKSGRAYVPNTDPAATVLGEAQWTWLAEQLRQPADLRLIGSSIQVVAEDHPFEKWSNFPRERERLFRLLRDTQAQGVVLLSGDRHLAELSLMDANLGYPLYDLTSSGLNMGFPRWRGAEKNSHRVATMTHGDNFGLVTIDWSATPPRVALQIRDVEGDIVVQQKLTLAQLQPASSTASSAGGASTAAAPPKPSHPEAISPADAIKKVGEKVLVEMKVKGTGKARDGSRVFLNSGDFRDKDNFTVVLELKKLEAGLKEANITDPAAHYKTKTILVSGTVTVFRDSPQIVVNALDQIRVVEPAP